MPMTDMWIVRKGEDAQLAKAPPEIADAISNHSDSNPKCLICREDHESAAVMAWRAPSDFVIRTAGICARCAEPSNVPRIFSGWVERHPKTG
jgi:hypothetical protein